MEMIALIEEGGYLEILKGDCGLNGVFEVNETIVEFSTAFGLFYYQTSSNEARIRSEDILVRGKLRATSLSLASIGTPSI